MADEQLDLLMVDDDPDDVFLVQASFRHVAPELRFAAASDAEEAARLLESCTGPGGPGAPRLVLLDVQLPRADGFQLLRRLRADERFAAIPVFMLSSSTEPDDVETAYAAGANGYLAKEPGLDALHAICKGIAEYLVMIGEHTPDRPPASDQTPEAAKSA